MIYVCDLCGLGIVKRLDVDRYAIPVHEHPDAGAPGGGLVVRVSAIPLVVGALARRRAEEHARLMSALHFVHRHGELVGIPDSGFTVHLCKNMVLQIQIPVARILLDPDIPVTDGIGIHMEESCEFGCTGIDIAFVLIEVFLEHDGQLCRARQNGCRRSQQKQGETQRRYTHPLAFHRYSILCVC